MFIQLWNEFRRLLVIEILHLLLWVTPKDDMFVIHSIRAISIRYSNGDMAWKKSER